MLFLPVWEYFTYHIMCICAQVLESGLFCKLLKWCHYEITQYQQFGVQANLFWWTSVFIEHDVFKSPWYSLYCKSVLSNYFLNLDIKLLPHMLTSVLLSSVLFKIWLKFASDEIQNRGSNTLKLWAESNLPALLRTVHKFT